MAYGHGGALYSDVNQSDSLDVGDVGLQTLIMKFPARVQLALSINSVDSTWRNTSGIVKAAFDAAWVKE